MALHGESAEEGRLYTLVDSISATSSLLGQIADADSTASNAATSLAVTQLPTIDVLRQVHRELEALVVAAEQRLSRLRTDSSGWQQAVENCSNEHNATDTATTQGPEHAETDISEKRDTMVPQGGSGMGSEDSGVEHQRRRRSKIAGEANRAVALVASEDPNERQQTSKAHWGRHASEPSRRRRSERDPNDILVKEESKEVVSLSARGTDKRAGKKSRGNANRKRAGAGSGSQPGVPTPASSNSQTSVPVAARRGRDQAEEPPLPKVTNQVPIHVFWNSLDPYFRVFTENDARFLEEDDDNISPYLIPLLGRHYLQVWAEEDRALIPNLGKDKSENGKSDHTPSVGGHPEQLLADDLLEVDVLSCGPLTERIISGLVRNEVGFPTDYKRGSETHFRADKLDTDLVSVEERLKRELVHLGLLDEKDINWQAAEDDEICAELRSLQRELRQVEADNKQRKRRLATIVRHQLGYQEYAHLLDELDRQVEQSFARRQRAKKPKRKRGTGTKAGLSDMAISALDRRRRLVDMLGSLFPPESVNVPDQSIFQ